MEPEGDLMRLKIGLIVVAGAAAILAGCGSDQDKMERGIATAPEVAVPQSKKELEMTEAERRAAAVDEDEEQEAKLFEESQQ
jgi:hypothetical protein